jgi:uncharacterized membrane protein YtjA (UPF0391 family)
MLTFAYRTKKQLLRRRNGRQKGRPTMLSWAITFLIIALIALALGFGGVAGLSMDIAWILFVVFIVLFLVSLVAPRFRPPTA